MDWLVTLAPVAATRKTLLAVGKCSLHKLTVFRDVTQTLTIEQLKYVGLHSQLIMPVYHWQVCSVCSQWSK